VSDLIGDTVDLETETNQTEVNAEQLTDLEQGTEAETDAVAVDAEEQERKAREKKSQADRYKAQRDAERAKADDLERQLAQAKQQLNQAKQQDFSKLSEDEKLDAKLNLREQERLIKEAEEHKNFSFEQARLADFRAKQAERIAELPDWGTTLVEASHKLALGVQTDKEIGEFAIDSDLGADLLYHIATTEEGAKLKGKTGRALERALLKIEMRLEDQGGAKPKSTQPQVTKAPAPAPKIGSGKGAPPAKDPSSMNMEEYAEWRKSQKKG
jgi:hypothetical protein